jgi:hypothetical protein
MQQDVFQTGHIAVMDKRYVHHRESNSSHKLLFMYYVLFPFYTEMQVST